MNFYVQVPAYGDHHVQELPEQRLRRLSGQICPRIVSR